jgi:hypothetical protein
MAQGSPPPDRPTDRASRLGEALRANLRRRRVQEQARADDPDASALTYRAIPVKPTGSDES